MKNHTNFYKSFCENLNLLGFENSQNFNYKNEDIEKFSNIFLVLNYAMSEQNNNDKLLSNGEKLILNNFDSNHQEISESCEYNSSILELNQSLLESEIELLEMEFQNLDKELQKENILYDNDRLEFENLSSKNLILDLHTKNSDLILQKELKYIEEQQMNILSDKCLKLCENSLKIISEYDINLKGCKNNSNVIVDFKKFNNEEFIIIMKNLENILLNLISRFEDISSNDTNNFEESNDFKMSDFILLINKFENLSQV